MQRLVQGLSLLLGLLTAGAAHAGTFYTNTGRPALHAAWPASAETADDVPFTGSHIITSFTISYESTAAANAIFRFRSINPDLTPGPVVAMFTAPNLPVGNHTFTMNLTPAQQFTWTATPGGIPGSQAGGGGFFSVQFTTPNGGDSDRTIGWLEASGDSTDSFFDFGRNIFVSFAGDGEASLYLQLTDNGVVGAPQLTKLTFPSGGVTGGQRTTGTVTLSSAAPAGGVVVDLDSEDPGVASVPDSVTIPAGRTSATFTVNTRRVQRSVAIGITAMSGEISLTTDVVVLQPGK